MRKILVPFMIVALLGFAQGALAPRARLSG